jgi:CubicO group peptidase (beta-lactamase class C family)
VERRRALSLDLAAAKPPLFAPGTSFSYSNTDYTLLGLIIEGVTGRSWRQEVTRRVIRPLRLTRTALPARGQRSIKGPLAHGYVELDGRLVDERLEPVRGVYFGLLAYEEVLPLLLPWAGLAVDLPAVEHRR